MLYHLYFFGKEKGILVVFLFLYICTFVYAITYFFLLLLFDSYMVLTVKTKQQREKTKKQNERRERKM